MPTRNAIWALALILHRYSKTSWAKPSENKKSGTSRRLHRFSSPIDLSSPCQLTPSLKPGGCPQNSFCLPLTIAAAGAAAEGVTAAETI